jgi:hypothetical protein
MVILYAYRCIGTTKSAFFVEVGPGKKIRDGSGTDPGWVPVPDPSRQFFWAGTGTDIYVCRIGMYVAYPPLTKNYIKNIYIHTGLYVPGLRRIYIRGNHYKQKLYTSRQFPSRPAQRGSFPKYPSRGDFLPGPTSSFLQKKSANSRFKVKNDCAKLVIFFCEPCRSNKITALRSIKKVSACGGFLSSRKSLARGA